MEEMQFDEDRLGDLVRQFIPGILIQLLINGKIDKEKMSDSNYLWSKVINERRDISSDIFYIVDFHDDFLEVARHSMDNGKKEVAIVLIATTIEHVLNMNYRQIMRFSGFSDQDITKVIKNNNFEDKMSWLMSLIFKKDLEPELRKNIKVVIDIRNAIVHYKVMPFTLRDEYLADSHSIIRNQIDNLDFDILLIPEKLDEVLNAQFIELNPEFQSVDNMMKVMFSKIKSPVGTCLEHNIGQ